MGKIAEGLQMNTSSDFHLKIIMGAISGVGILTGIVMQIHRLKNTAKDLLPTWGKPKREAINLLTYQS